MPSPSLSIVVPAFNEEASIATCLRELRNVLPPDSEILVIDGGSDRSLEIVQEIAQADPRVRYWRNKNDRGKGHAIRTGIATAKAGVIAFFDADLQFYAEDLLKLTQPLIDGKVDVTIGSRFRRESAKDTQANPIRSAGNWIVSAFVTILFGQRITDALAGVKAMTRQAAAKIDLQSDSFEYEVEIVANAIRHGLRLKEIPIDTRHRAAGESKVSIFQIGARILLSTLHFRFSKLSKN